MLCENGVNHVGLGMWRMSFQKTQFVGRKCKSGYMLHLRRIASRLHVLRSVSGYCIRGGRMCYVVSWCKLVANTYSVLLHKATAVVSLVHEALQGRHLYPSTALVQL